MTISVSPTNSITLYADGTYTGSHDAMETLLTVITVHDQPAAVAGAVTLWLLLRAMQDDAKVGRAPRAAPVRRRQ